jgi:hypothetical protein
MKSAILEKLHMTTLMAFFLLEVISRPLKNSMEIDSHQRGGMCNGW